jgi:hypothetical protein
MAQAVAAQYPLSSRSLDQLDHLPRTASVDHGPRPRSGGKQKRRPTKASGQPKEDEKDLSGKRQKVEKKTKKKAPTAALANKAVAMVKNTWASVQGLAKKKTSSTPKEKKTGRMMQKREHVTKDPSKEKTASVRQAEAVGASLREPNVVALRNFESEELLETALAAMDISSMALTCLSEATKSSTDITRRDTQQPVRSSNMDMTSAFASAVNGAADSAAECADDAPPLLADWMEEQDPQTGKSYYWNTVTNETSWERQVATATPRQWQLAAQSMKMSRRRSIHRGDLANDGSPHKTTTQQDKAAPSFLDSFRQRMMRAKDTSQ